MIIYETVTEVGEGIWYKPYQIELVTVTTHHPYRFQECETVTIEYELRFRELVPNAPVDHRRFPSSEARADFIAEGITSLTLQPAPESQISNRVPYFGDALIGCHLVSVTFILDYLQLAFEDDQGNAHHFNLYQFPTIVTPTGNFSATTWGYADAFRTFINKTLNLFEEYVDAGLIWELEENSRIELSLHASAVFETAQYSRSSKDWFQIWYSTMQG